MKKKLVVLTKEHEALFNFVENNRHICTEKEKQKVELMFFLGGGGLTIILYCLKKWLTVLLFLH